MTTEVTELTVDDTTNEDVKVGQNVPMKKRKKAEDGESEIAEMDEEAKRVKVESEDDLKDQGLLAHGDEDLKPLKRPPMSKAREIRLEQNRKAARESRRRKKVMIEELQRSVIFFSRANGTLKQQNDELSRLLMQAQAQIAAAESGQQAAQGQEAHQQASGNEASQDQTAPPQAAPAAAQQQMQYQNMAQQAQAQAVATQAMYESQGFPPAAARAAAQTINASTPAPATAAAQTPGAGANPSLPPMQPGATMQAMANFQQAAAAAMQAAMGMNPASAAAAANGSQPAAAAPTPQQTYTDTLNALAMQQAAAVGQAQFAVLGIPQMQQNMQGAAFMAHPSMIAGATAAPMAWQQPGAPAPANGQPAPAPQATAQHASS